jgi:hypothetical protein
MKKISFVLIFGILQYGTANQQCDDTKQVYMSGSCCGDGGGSSVCVSPSLKAGNLRYYQPTCTKKDATDLYALYDNFPANAEPVAELYVAAYYSYTGLEGGAIHSVSMASYDTIEANFNLSHQSLENVQTDHSWVPKNTAELLRLYNPDGVTVKADNSGGATPTGNLVDNVGFADYDFNNYQGNIKVGARIGLRCKADNTLIYVTYGVVTNGAGFQFGKAMGFGHISTEAGACDHLNGKDYLLRAKSDPMSRLEAPIVNSILLVNINYLLYDVSTLPIDINDYCVQFGEGARMLPRFN